MTSSSTFGRRFAAAAAAMVVGAALLVAAPANAEPTPTIDRLFGADRYGTSADIAETYAPFAAGTGVVYVATGENFPDALSAAAAAAFQDAPLLLTAGGALPAVVKAQIVRLHPNQIKVVGGEAAVSAGVYATLAALAPNIERLSGTDRYRTSKEVVVDAFLGHAHSNRIFLATGRNFPDALSAAAAAGRLGAPVLLVDGMASSVDQGTLDLMDLIGTVNVNLMGSLGVMSQGVENSLDAQLFVTDVIRFAGADRYETSALVNAYWFSSPANQSVYFATGTGFADALSGAALAGSKSSPLYLTPSNCVSRGAYDELVRIGATTLTLLGGVSALGPNVYLLLPCDEIE